MDNRKILFSYYYKKDLKFLLNKIKNDYWMWIIAFFILIFSLIPTFLYLMVFDPISKMIKFNKLNKKRIIKFIVGVGFFIDFLLLLFFAYYLTLIFLERGIEGFLGPIVNIIIIILILLFLAIFNAIIRIINEMYYKKEKIKIHEDGLLYIGRESFKLKNLYILFKRKNNEYKVIVENRRGKERHIFKLPYSVGEEFIDILKKTGMRRINKKEMDLEEYEKWRKATGVFEVEGYEQ